jgi:hypothetical protein
MVDGMGVGVNKVRWGSEWGWLGTLGWWGACLEGLEVGVCIGAGGTAAVLRHSHARLP